MPKALDLTNQRFGKLIARRKAPSRSGKTYWLCECDCGNWKEVQTSHLTNHKIQSCGCIAWTRKDGTYGPKYCLNCGEQLTKGETKYCSTKCQRAYENQIAVQAIFSQKESGLKNASSSSPKIRDSLRKYLLEKANYKCQLCGCNWVNPYSNQTILEIHHIDGDRNNNLENNLQVLCPNCHAMTPNYRGLNIKRDK